MIQAQVRSQPLPRRHAPIHPFIEMNQSGDLHTISSPSTDSSHYRITRPVLHEISAPETILPDLETDLNVHDIMLEDFESHLSDALDLEPLDTIASRHGDGDANDGKLAPNLRRRLRRFRNNVSRGRKIIKDRVMTLSVRLERTLTHRDED